MPQLINEQYSVTYSAAADAFLFDFTTPGIPTYTVRRVGFSYALSNAAPDGVTFYSNYSSESIQFDGLTVRSSNCTSPTGANPLALYNTILALYVVSPPVVPTELQAFRHGAEAQTLQTGSGDPSYVNWYQSATHTWDYDYNSDGRFEFPDANTVRITQEGVYHYDVNVSARGSSSTRAWTMFLDTSGVPMNSQPDNPQLGAMSQVSYPATWSGSDTLTTCSINGSAFFTAGTKLRIAYTTEADIVTLEQYTGWTMEYRPEVLNAGPQGDQGIPGNDGADGADGVVQTVTGTAPIVLSGTAADRVVSHATSGVTATTYPWLYNTTFNATGHATAATAAPQPTTDVQATAPLTVANSGVAPNKVQTIAHSNSGVTATTYSVPYNLVFNDSGHCTGAANSANAWFTVAQSSADLSVAIGGTHPNRSFRYDHATFPGVTGTFAYPSSVAVNARGHVTAIAAGAPELLANKNQPNGYAGLGPLGKIAASQLPSIAITDTYVVGPYADLVTLTAAEVGDVGIVSADADNTKEGSWILQTDPYSTLSNWVRLIPPTAAGVVYTVNGQAGPNVVIDANEITNGTLSAAQLPALSATGDATGTGTAGTGSIPLILADTSVTAGSYTFADITVDSKGRLTAAASGTAVLPASQLPALSATGDATGTGTAGTGSIPLTLTTTGVTAGSYTNADITVGADGRITAAANGTSGSGIAMQYTGALNNISAWTGAAQLITPTANSVGSITLPANTIGAAKAVTGVFTGRLDTTALAPVLTFDMGLAGNVVGSFIGIAITPGPYTFRVEFMWVPGTPLYQAYTVVNNLTTGTVSSATNNGAYFGATNITLDCQPIVTLLGANAGDLMQNMVYSLQIHS